MLTFLTFLAKKPEDSIALQLKELITNEILVTLFPNLQMIASISLTLPVSTASVERSFSQVKLIKTCLRNSLTDDRLTQLMRIAIKSPEQLTEDEIEVTLDIEQETSRNIYLNPANNYRNNSAWAVISNV